MSGQMKPSSVGSESAETSSSFGDPPPSLFGLVRRVSTAHSAAWRAHVDSTITSAQFDVMTALQRVPGISQIALADAVCIDSSTLSDVCRRLVRANFLSRSPCKQDARQKLFALTCEGREVLDKLQGRARQLAAELSAVPTLQSEDALAEILDNVADHWELIAEQDADRSG